MLIEGFGNYFVSKKVSKIWIIIIEIQIFLLLCFVSIVKADNLENNLRQWFYTSCLIDMGQTTNIRSIHNTQETNPILGKKPSNETIVPYFLVATLGYDYLVQTKIHNKYLKQAAYIVPAALESYLIYINNPKRGMSNNINFVIKFSIPF